MKLAAGVLLLGSTILFSGCGYAEEARRAEAEAKRAQAEAEKARQITEAEKLKADNRQAKNDSGNSPRPLFGQVPARSLVGRLERHSKLP